MAKNYEFKIDTSDFDKKINKIQKNFPNFISHLLKQLGLRLLARVKRLTPVDTGLLRKSWFLENPKVQGSKSYIEIKNNVKYGLPIEEGRKTKGGGFVAGRFMLKKGMNEINREAPRIIESEIQKFINQNGGGR